MFLSIALLSLIWENGAASPGGRAYPAGFAGFFKSDTLFDWLPVAYGALDVSTVTQTNYWYDISANAWNTRADGPAPARYDLAGTFAVLSGEKQLFVFGGYGGAAYRNAAARYRYSTNAWTAIANLPYNAEGVMAAGTIGGYIYVFGGANAGGQLNNTNRYDPVGNSYLARTAMPRSKSEAGCAIAVNENGDSCVYLVSGMSDDEGDSWGYTLSTWEYNPSSNAWRQRADFTGTAVNGSSAATLRNRIYVMGGYNIGNSADYTQVMIYNPVNNTWSSGPSLPVARDGGVATAPDFPLQGVSLVRPVNDATCCNDTLFWRRGTGAVKIVYAGTGTATSVINTCQRLRSVVQGYVLKYDTLSNFATASVVWNNMDGSGTDDRDTTEPLSNLTLVDDHWYYWTVGVVDDMPDTAWSADTFRFYYDCEPAYDEVNESSGDAKPSLENALARGPDILLTFVTPLSGLYSLRIYDSGGRLAWLREFGAEQGRNELPVWLPGPGVYMAIIEGQGISERARIVVTGR